ncbi:MAG TPA: hypothetical protein VJB13_04340 [Candidatus Nanoarchaeia archaeon]|nr:hypothetical protein [Candidatus Nanoarchaeia archaeon]
MALNVKIVERSPSETGDIIVSPFNDYKTGSTRLHTNGIGPCLAIALYDPIRKIGSLAHISGVIEVGKEAVYPHYIVRSLVAEIGVYQTLEAVLAGESLRPIKISDTVKRDLNFLNIPIVVEDLGDNGTHLGRAVTLDCQTGEVTIYRLPPLQF